MIAPLVANILRWARRAPASAAAIVLAVGAAAPADEPRAEPSWKVPLEVVGPSGFARGGVPFPKGRLRPDEPLRLDGASFLDTEILSTWGDGTVRWLLVETIAGGTVSLEPGEGLAGPGVDPANLAAGLVLLVDGVRADLSRAEWRVERETSLSVRLAAHGVLTNELTWRARLERTVAGPADRLRLEIRNPRPTGERGGQPTGLRLGCPGTVPVERITLRTGRRAVEVRWADENGARTVPGGVDLVPSAMELRPGEQFGWEIVFGEGVAEPALLEFPAHWGCRSGALGPLAPFDLARFADYERNVIAGARGLRAGRNRPHWRNPREHGEDQRDWDGGDVQVDFQTHNNEYEVHLAYAKQRVRTMGLHETSRDWHYLGLTGARHFANVDIYHVHEGPLPWMHGAAFQHVKHGGTGRETMHRSVHAPNLSHQTGRGLLAWYRLTGDPLLRESFLEVAENVRWRVANGPGRPGFSNTAGEERAPAMALGLLTDAWVETGDPGFLEAARQVVTESHARTKDYVISPAATTWRCKPWMIALLVGALEEFAEAAEEYGAAADVVEARESARRFQVFLRQWVIEDGAFTRLPYQVSLDPDRYQDDSRDSWNVVAADALVGHDPEVAGALFRSGSRCIWYPGHPVGEYATLLTHTVLAGGGHRTMSVMRERAGLSRAE